MGERETSFGGPDLKTLLLTAAFLICAGSAMAARLTMYAALNLLKFMKQAYRVLRALARHCISTNALPTMPPK